MVCALLCISKPELGLLHNDASSGVGRELMSGFLLEGIDSEGFRPNKIREVTDSASASSLLDSSAAEE